MDRAIRDLGLVGVVVKISDRVHHPRSVLTLGEVFASVRPSAFLAGFRGVHGGGGVGEEVPEKEGREEGREG